MTDSPSGPAAPADEPVQPPQWEERDAWTALDDLDAAPALVPASEWPAGVTCLDRPGLFAFWVDEAGAGDLARGLDLPVDPGRVFVGQAGATKWPSGRANDDTLGGRIGGIELGGKVRASGMRWTLASILFDRLELQGQAAMLLTPSSEQALSGWIREHLSVALHPHDARDTLGGLAQAIVQRLDSPLNLEDHVSATLVRERVAALRKRISREG